MTEEQEKVISRIKKLLNIAKNDSSSDGDIKAAMNAVQGLMDRHHLTEDDLAHEPKDDYARVDSASFGKHRCWLGKKIFCWEGTLGTFVSKLVGCPCYTDTNILFYRDRNGIVKRDANGEALSGQSIVFYGIAEDAQIAQELYDELRATIAIMAVARFNGCYKGDGALYAEGFVSGLWSQLQDSIKTEKRIAQENVSTNSSALIVIERRADLVKYKETAARTWLQTTEGLKPVKCGKRVGASGDMNAYATGKADGVKADVTVTRTKKLN